MLPFTECRLTFVDRLDAQAIRGAL